MDELRKQLDKHMRTTHALMIGAEETRKECAANSWDEGFQRGLVLAYTFGEERLAEAIEALNFIEQDAAYAI